MRWFGWFKRKTKIQFARNVKGYKITSEGLSRIDNPEELARIEATLGKFEVEVFDSFEKVLKEADKIFSSTNQAKTPTSPEVAEAEKIIGKANPK